MLIDGKEIDIDDVIANKDSFIEKHGNIYITKQQINILDNYGIDINKYNNYEQLSYEIENILNDSYEPLEDLEWVSQSLSEYNYYNNTNK